MKTKFLTVFSVFFCLADLAHAANSNITYRIGEKMDGPAETRYIGGGHSKIGNMQVSRVLTIYPDFKDDRMSGCILSEELVKKSGSNIDELIAVLETTDSTLDCTIDPLTKETIRFTVRKNP